jgi:uncharacterized Fe-S cluster protein YjdI
MKAETSHSTACLLHRNMQQVRTWSIKCCCRTKEREVNTLMDQRNPSQANKPSNVCKICCMHIHSGARKRFYTYLDMAQIGSLYMPTRCTHTRVSRAQSKYRHGSPQYIQYMPTRCTHTHTCLEGAKQVQRQYIQYMPTQCTHTHTCLEGTKQVQRQYIQYMPACTLAVISTCAGKCFSFNLCM